MKKVIDKIISSKDVRLGNELMKQPLPHEKLDNLDPFLLIQHGKGEVKKNTHQNNVGVGPHPHRGFSPVTFVFTGDVHHRDSQGNDAVVEAGGTQWMHAGRGIIHSERPSEEFSKQGGETEIIQFWVNSPASQKMTTPYYQPISNEETPKIEIGGAEIAIVAGEYDGVVGPAKTLTKQSLLRINTGENSNFEVSIPENYNCLVYLLDGELVVNGNIVLANQMVSFLREGSTISIQAKESTRAILLAGEPIGEEIATYGPFVMNTQTEIMQALRDSQMGKMGVLIEE